MFSRFAENAIEVIMKAQDEARRLGNDFVGTEHILLGILKVKEDNVVKQLITKSGYSVKKIMSAIERESASEISTNPYVELPFTSQSKHVLTMAWEEARQLGHSHVNVEHIFLSLLREKEGVASKILIHVGIVPAKIRKKLLETLSEKVSTEAAAETAQETNTPLLNEFGRDLTWLAKKDKLDPLVGRSQEMDRIIQILARRTKNNPVLTGDAGVGKTAIVEGLAQKIIAGNVPKSIQDKRVISLDLGLMVAGTKYRGEFEERMKKIMEEIKKATNIMIFVDELHTIIGTGSTEGSLDVANMFKPALARGELQCIGATTLNEYRKYIEHDAALERRFQSVLIDEPSVEETIHILKGIQSRYEEYHNVKFTPEAITAAAHLSKRYINDRNLPDKAIDLIDEAASRVIMHERGPKVTKNDIAEILSQWTHIPVKQMTEEESKRIVSMDDLLKEKIIGQSEAIEALGRAIRRSKAGLKDPRRPTGSFIFCGPSGVGKTESAKVLSEFLFGDPDAVIRIDMSEYTEKHTTSRLIGSPPGYVGHEEGGQLTEPIRRKPYSIVLFDEIEKASPEVVNLLLQILDEGRLTDSIGRTVNFKNTIIIMTSNVGAKYIQKETTYGFVPDSEKHHTGYEKMKEKILDEMKNEFRPEFLNRVDDIIIFKALSHEVLEKIAELMLKEVEQRLKERHLHIEITKEAKKLMAKKSYKENLGARPLRRTIQIEIEDKIADKILTGEVRKNDIITVDKKDDEFVINITHKEPTKETKEKMENLEKKPPKKKTSVTPKKK
ncbi:ATP-dependent Clp protease ATP-binding subunit [Candidatus Margulisiibacteriota bacterium]